MAISVAAAVALTVLAAAQVQGPIGPTVSEALLDLRQENLERRVAQLESAHVDSRLAVLEEGLSDWKEMKRLQYGVIASVVAGLVAQVIMIKGQRGQRR